MNNDILKPKEENLFSLATELGLVVFSEDVPEEKSVPAQPDAEKQKPATTLG